MCGIIGYIGEKQAEPILIDGLKRLEYRGYDSAGIALIENSKLQVFKKGKVSELEKFFQKILRAKLESDTLVGQHTARQMISTLIHTTIEITQLR